MLYTAPLVDVILLLIIFFLFGSNLVLKSGVELNLPRSGSSLPAAEDAHILTLIPGETAEFFFNDERIELAQLGEKLEESKERSGQVILLGDEAISYGTVMEVAGVVLEKGFQLSLATQQRNP